uniref:Thymidylate synthase n=1 Tax=viral metagenome TaxID=1070528 RepID=A0A6C0CZ30_9ZZZZ
MFNVILAIDPDNGIGKNGILPWNCKDEIELFKKNTMGTILIMGKNTVNTLPYLPNREIYCVTSDISFSNTITNNVKCFTTFEKALEQALLENSLMEVKDIFVAGGAKLYNYVFTRHFDLIKKVYISIMHNIYDCDTYVEIPRQFVTESYVKYADFDYYILQPQKDVEEFQYLNLLKDVLVNGDKRNTRNGYTLSLFGKHLKFDLRNQFPLLTTKKMFTRGIIEELLFFIRGETDSKKLEEKNVTIWKGNTSTEFLKSMNLPYAEGVLGPCFVKGTNVLTSNGYKSIENVLITDLLYSHLGNWKAITEIFIKNYKENLLSVKLNAHSPIVTTPDHPFYARRVSSNCFGFKNFDQPKWISAKELDNNYVVGMKIEKTDTEDNFMFSQSDEMWFLFGLFVAGGNIENDIVYLSINNTDTNTIDRVKPIIILQMVREIENKYRFYDDNIRILLQEWFGDDIYTKWIPNQLHKAPNHLIRIFLEGYLSSNNCIADQVAALPNCKRYTIESTDVAYSIQRLYLKLGYIASLSVIHTKFNVPNIPEKIYLLELYEYENIYPNSFIENDYCWFAVECTNIVLNSETLVYNFDVVDDHTYTVENTSVHNCYGYQWRYFNSPYMTESGRPIIKKLAHLSYYKGIDQLKYVIDLIKSDPTSRRILMTTFNPMQARDGVLFPCHSITLQFYVQDNYIDMFCYNRSSDLFLGLPFNIASSSLLLILISKVCKLTPRYFHLSLGDCHIYDSHIEAVRTQISRIPYKFPTIMVNDVNSIEDIENMSSDDFKLYDYYCHSSIKAEMIV